MHRILLLFACAAIFMVTGTASALDPINVNLIMPDLTCGKGEQQPNECILSGRIAVRGPQTMNGPFKYYCDLRYTYVAAGSEQQEIRFNGRVLHHGEVTLTNGRARVVLETPVTITLSQKARRIELAEIACYAE